MSGLLINCHVALETGPVCVEQTFDPAQLLSGFPWRNEAGVLAGAQSSLLLSLELAPSVSPLGY